MIPLSTFRVLAVSLLAGALSLGALAPAVAQNDKQQNPPASQSAPAEKPNGQAASAADQRPPEPVSSPVSSIVQQQRPTLDELKQLTKKINEQLSKSASSDEALANLKLQLDGLSKKLLETGVAFRPRLTEINTRLEQPGPAPSSDQPAEPAIVGEERARLIAEKAEINATLGETEDTSLAVNRMSALIGDMRRDLFTKTLSQRVNLDSTLGSEVVSAASDQMISLWRIVRSWWRFVVTFKLESFLAAAFFALAAALVLQFGAQRFLGAFYRRDPSVDPHPI